MGDVEVSTYFYLKTKEDLYDVCRPLTPICPVQHDEHSLDTFICLVKKDVMCFICEGVVAAGCTSVICFYWSPNPYTNGDSCNFLCGDCLLHDDCQGQNDQTIEAYGELITIFRDRCINSQGACSAWHLTRHERA